MGPSQEESSLTFEALDPTTDKSLTANQSPDLPRRKHGSKRIKDDDDEY
jgi:hypothetical protein